MALTVISSKQYVCTLVYSRAYLRLAIATKTSQLVEEQTKRGGPAGSKVVDKAAYIFKDGWI